MFEQIISLINQQGQDAVVKNPEVPDEYNKEVMADATHTITSGFQHMMAGGGFENILDLFRNNGKGGDGNGLASLMKSPVVSMMIGYFSNKLVNKYKMSPESAGKVANNLIPNTLNDLISKTKSTAPENSSFDFNSLIGSLTGGKVNTAGGSGGGFNFQDLLQQVTGNHTGAQPGGGNGFDLQDIISQVTQGARQQQGENSSRGGGGIMDMIKGFLQ